MFLWAKVTKLTESCENILRKMAIFLKFTEKIESYTEKIESFTEKIVSFTEKIETCTEKIESITMKIDTFLTFKIRMVLLILQSNQ